MLDRYRLNHHGSLLWTKAAFHSLDRDTIITARMLIDTSALIDIERSEIIITK